MKAVLRASLVSLLLVMAALCSAVSASAQMAQFGSEGAGIPGDQIVGWDGYSYQYVQFGRYPQGADGEIQPILWRVLGRRDRQAVLLQSEYILEYSAISDQSIGKWYKTDLHHFLNSDRSGAFLADAFTPAELTWIHQRENYPPVFILHETNLQSEHYGMKKVANRSALPTHYAATKYGLTGEEGSFYWMRRGSNDAAWEKWGLVDSSGAFHETSDYTHLGGVRPTLYLYVDGLFTAGTGTFADPYR